MGTAIRRADDAQPSPAPASSADKHKPKKGGRKRGEVAPKAVQKPMPVTQPDLFTLAEETPPAPAGGLPFPVALLALGTVNGLGQRALRHLVSVYGDDLGAALTVPRDELAGVLADGQVAGAVKLADAIASNPDVLVREGAQASKALEARGVVVLPPSGLPDRLRGITPDPPLWLFVHGEAGLLDDRPAVALVGTRTPSERGLRMTAAVAKILAPYPVVVVSGLAEGIDDEAHRASLAHGLRNVAFLGHGIEQVFPTSTLQTREAIVRGSGAVVTEYLPWEHSQKRFFVERNRLQAGLADLVIPVEAQPTGGTAHTVRFAREFGRRLVGVRWPGVTGIVSDLEQAGAPVFDVTTAAGCQGLDRVVRQLVEGSGKEVYPLVNAERQLLREIRSRAVTRDDIGRLIRRLEGVSREVGDGARPAGGDL